jgi:hypothetical protein
MKHAALALAMAPLGEAASDQNGTKWIFRQRMTIWDGARVRDGGWLAAREKCMTIEQTSCAWSNAPGRGKKRVCKAFLGVARFKVACYRIRLSEEDAIFFFTHPR